LQIVHADAFKEFFPPPSSSSPSDLIFSLLVADIFSKMGFVCSQTHTALDRGVPEPKNS